ncbi:MAG: hypothetical protein AB7U25_10765 [Vicinamibacterales bacterium]
MRTPVLLLLLGSAIPVAAQSPDAPAAAVPRVAVSGEVTATVGSHDPGFFNYATYDYSPLRNVRIILNSSLRVSRHVEILGQIRTDGLSHAQLTALYLRARPWPDRDVDLQIGRVPPTFGLFGPAGYGTDNPLISRPLAYGYLLSLRRDALPRTVTDLVGMRGRGWLSQFPLGNPAPDRGLPLIDAEHWDTGVQGRVRAGVVEWIGAVTAGSLAGPRVEDDNGGRSLQTRLVVRPHPLLALGVSGARGAYLSDDLAAVLPAGQPVDTFTQRAAGADVALAAGRWALRGEIIRTWWSVPAVVDSRLAPALVATAAWGEGRWRAWPGLDLTARVERLSFGDVAGPSGPTPWEAAVTRVESGVGFAVRRHVRLKAVWQRNWRPGGGRVRHDSLVAGQIGVWF